MAAVGGCGNCGSGPCDCTEGYGLGGPGGKMVSTDPAQMPGERKGRADQDPLAGVPGPLVAGAQMRRPPRIPGRNDVGNLNLNFGSTPAYSYGTSQSQGNNQSQSRGGSYVDQTKLGLYNQLLGMNTQNYNNVLNTYNQGQDELRSNLGGVYGKLPGVYQGTRDLQGAVANTLGMGQVLGQNGNWGVAAPAAQAIGNAYQQAQGRTTQQMTNAGLGNTTAVGNAQAQNTAQAAQQYGALGASLADKAAGYQSQLGQFGQQQQMQGLGMGMQGAGMQADAAWKRAGGLQGMDFKNTFGNLDSNYSMANSSGQNMSNSQQYSYGGNPGMDMGGYGADQMGQNPMMDIANVGAFAPGGGGLYDGPFQMGNEGQGQLAGQDWGNGWLNNFGF